MEYTLLLSILVGILIAIGSWAIKVLLKLSRQTQDLHTWHDKEDEDGVKVWYVRHSLELAIINLSKNIEKQTLILTRMLSQSVLTERTLEDLQDKIK